MSTGLLISEDGALYNCLKEALSCKKLMTVASVSEGAKLVNESSAVEVVLLDEPTLKDIEDMHERYPRARLIALLSGGGKIETCHVPVKFLEKPFRLHALQHLLGAPREEEVLVIGEFKLYPKQRLLTCVAEEKKGYLTEKEVDILTFLYHHPYQIFSKEELLKQVWNYAPDMTTHTLETHIYRLRQKLTPSLVVYQ